MLKKLVKMARCYICILLNRARKTLKGSRKQNRVQPNRNIFMPSGFKGNFRAPPQWRDGSKKIQNRVQPNRNIFMLSGFKGSFRAPPQMEGWIQENPKSDHWFKSYGPRKLCSKQVHEDQNGGDVQRRLQNRRHTKKAPPKICSVC